MKPMTTLNLKVLIEFAFRIYVFIILNIYALGKLMGGQFYTPDSIPEVVYHTSLGEASNFDLAWTFMGRSYGYILFIGITQIVGSWLLLFNRTKLIGTLILIPVMANIIVFDIFFLDKYGALASASIYFIMLISILLFNASQVRSALIKLIGPSKKFKQLKMASISKILLALVMVGIIFLLDQLLVNLFGHGKG
ncbi:MAG TPA: hypothetical protein DDX98_02795 [Bacteroidales bacterium]|jgi:hypothetical protein|nr:hypothetical protein [Bacteroidales bacterium]